MRRPIRLFALLALSVGTAACGGLQPLYGNVASTGNASVAQGLAAVDVAPIPGRAGWLVRNALNDRLGVAGEVGSRYTLDVQLDDSLQGLGVLNDDTITRERRVLRARYQLTDTSNGAILLDASTGSDAGIDVVSSEYATIAAEQRALENLALNIADRMVTRISLALREGQQEATESAAQP
ncbi:MAG: LPS assembly lipoprotein LptE [Erythrobacter sp.]